MASNIVSSHYGDFAEKIKKIEDEIIQVNSIKYSIERRSANLLSPMFTIPNYSPTSDLVCLSEKYDEIIKLCNERIKFLENHKVQLEAYISESAIKKDKQSLLELNTLITKLKISPHDKAEMENIAFLRSQIRV